MNIDTTHFEGSMEDLGIAFGEEHDEMLQRRLRGLQQHSSSVGNFFKPFMDGLEDITEIGRPNLGGMMEQETYQPSGSVGCIGGTMLYARYRFRSTDSVQVYYGELDGLPFFFMSMFPQLPGTLLGMGRSGLAWATKVPTRYNFEDGELPRLYSYGAQDWGLVMAVLLRKYEVNLSAPHPHKLIKNLPGYRHKGEPTPEHYARKTFEDATDAEDLLVILDSPKREVTLIRGNGSELTYDILAQD